MEGKSPTQTHQARRGETRQAAMARARPSSFGRVCRCQSRPRSSAECSPGTPHTPRAAKQRCGPAAPTEPAAAARGRRRWAAGWRWQRCAAARRIRAAHGSSECGAVGTACPAAGRCRRCCMAGKKAAGCKGQLRAHLRFRLNARCWSPVGQRLGAYAECCLHVVMSLQGWWCFIALYAWLHTFMSCHAA